MTGAGAAITVAAVDVADREALAGVLAAHPIRGVIHAAGVMSPAMIAAIAPDDLRAMMAAKVDGALHLHELTSSLDFFVAYSSVATLLGTPGQGAYAAANAYLDALAQHRRAIGLPATSIAWPVIEDTGMAAGAGARAMRQLAERGLLSVSVRRATEALDQLLAMADPPAHCGLAAFDVQRWRAFYPRSAASPRLSPLYDTPIEAAAADRRAGRGCRRERSCAASRARQRLDAVEDYLRTVLADVLETTEPLEPTRSLVDLGLDSMGALEVQEMVEAQLEVELATDRLLLGPTLRELAAEIATLLVPDDVRRRGSRTRAIAARRCGPGSGLDVRAGAGRAAARDPADRRDGLPRRVRPRRAARADRRADPLPRAGPDRRGRPASHRGCARAP